MSSTLTFAQYEQEASRLVRKIAALEDIGPEFLEARDQAQAQYERHIDLLSEARAELAEIRSVAAAAAMRLGEMAAKDESDLEDAETATPTPAEIITEALANMECNDPAAIFDAEQVEAPAETPIEAEAPVEAETPIETPVEVEKTEVEPADGSIYHRFGAYV